MRSRRITFKKIGDLGAVVGVAGINNGLRIMLAAARLVHERDFALMCNKNIRTQNMAIAYRSRAKTPIVFFTILPFPLYQEIPIPVVDIESIRVLKGFVGKIVKRFVPEGKKKIFPDLIVIKKS